ncbi:MAG: DNA replication/repair protein RecF [Paludibacteraceae bacterium]|jgi:DNA replication and repair protein RecF|nr:DNA replication/repair protein RecF [Paludibacteraceae bacterium]MEE0911628.1 DNA replication/repair protein RecF [Paludibacteraceae bacterium]
MQLNRLRIINYKNIREADLEFSDGINCLLGCNGAGKTNVLDAIYYLSFCKSHSNPIDTQNITHDEEFFMLEGNYKTADEEINIYCGVKKRHKKQFKRDKKDYEKLSEHIGLIPLVMISPSDEELIHGGSEERRKFIDGFISQYNKKYLQSLLSYKKILEQRNSMLKELQNDGLLFDVIEEQMSVLGVYIHQERKKFIEQFLPIFQDFHQTISSGKEVVQLEYKSQLGNGEELSTLLKATRERDFILGYTSKGIHKDDLEMTLDSMPIKRTGSQGQNKTFLIALKLSQFNLLEKISGKRPILLFDDMFDKLDKQRAEKIISILGGNQLGQIFISDTDRVSLPTILDESSYKYKLFTVESGEISLK